ncbi:MAG: hypothetical protein JSR59_05040 [Proteobacteria bacterium]|nr:hypothetical protein [Pseudomonadota bacterium]
MSDATLVSGPPAALPAGVVVDGYRIEQVASVSASAAVYAAVDTVLGSKVAIKEYLPARLAARDAGGQLVPFEDAAFERGLQSFLGEARALARCDDPCLVRVIRYAQGHGTGYRVMPWYHGRRLLDVRRESNAAPGEDALRILLDRLLDAIESFHATGQVHGAVQPGNILLLSDDRPLLLGPNWTTRRSSSELVDTLMASIRPPTPLVRELSAQASDESPGPWTDLHALAGVLRYCITGHLPAPSVGSLGPGAAGWPDSVRSAYSTNLLGVLDAALAADPKLRPQSVAQFRAWLEGMPDAAAPAPVVREDVESLIERVLHGVPTGAGVAAGAAAPAEPVWREPMQPPATAPDVPSFVLPDTATMQADAMADDAHGHTLPETSERRTPPAAPSSIAMLLWTRHRLAVLGTALVIGAALAWAVVSLRDARRDLRVVWPPSAEVGGTPGIARGDVPAAAPPVAASGAMELPVEPTRAGPVGAAQVAAMRPTPTPTATPEPAASSPAADEAVPAPATAHPRTATPRHAAAVRKAEAPKPTSPGELCAGRTPFATYRCMQTQCAKPRWTAHAQCRQLRTADRAGN